MVRLKRNLLYQTSVRALTFVVRDCHSHLSPMIFKTKLIFVSDGKNQVIVSGKSSVAAFFNNNSGNSYVRYRYVRYSVIFDDILSTYACVQMK